MVWEVEKSLSVGKIEVSEKSAAQDLKVLEKGLDEHTKNQNAPEFVVMPDFPIGSTRTGFMKRIAA